MRGPRQSTLAEPSPSWRQDVICHSTNREGEGLVDAICLLKKKR